MKSSFLLRLFSSVNNWLDRKFNSVPWIQNIPDIIVRDMKNIARNVLAKDPTYKGESSETVGKYGDWILRSLVSAWKLYYDEFSIYELRGFQNIAQDVITSISRPLYQFNILLQKGAIPKEHRDIYSFKDTEELYDYMNPAIHGEGAKLWENQRDQRTQKAKTFETGKIYEDSNWLVISPKTHEAAVAWRNGLKENKSSEAAFPWCVAYDSDEGKSFFNGYTANGKSPAIFWFDKNNTEEGYASVALPEEFKDKWNRPGSSLTQKQWMSLFPKEALKAATDYDPFLKKWLKDLPVKEGSWATGRDEIEFLLANESRLHWHLIPTKEENTPEARAIIEFLLKNDKTLYLKDPSEDSLSFLFKDPPKELTPEQRIPNRMGGYLYNLLHTLPKIEHSNTEAYMALAPIFSKDGPVWHLLVNPKDIVTPEEVLKDLPSDIREKYLYIFGEGE